MDRDGRKTDMAFMSPGNARNKPYLNKYDQAANALSDLPYVQKRNTTGMGHYKTRLAKLNQFTPDVMLEE